MTEPPCHNPGVDLFGQHDGLTEDLARAASDTNASIRSGSNACPERPSREKNFVLVAKRTHRINPQSATGWHQCRNDSDCHQQTDCGRITQRIEVTYAVQHVAQQLRQGRGRRCSKQYT